MEVASQKANGANMLTPLLRFISSINDTEPVTSDGVTGVTGVTGDLTAASEPTGAVQTGRKLTVLAEANEPLKATGAAGASRGVEFYGFLHAT